MKETFEIKKDNRFSDEFLQTIFLQAGDGIFLVEDQKIIAANLRGCEMFGYSHMGIRLSWRESHKPCRQATF